MLCYHGTTSACFLIPRKALSPRTLPLPVECGTSRCLLSLLACREGRELQVVLPLQLKSQLCSFRLPAIVFFLDTLETHAHMRLRVQTRLLKGEEFYKQALVSYCCSLQHFDGHGPEASVCDFLLY